MVTRDPGEELRNLGTHELFLIRFLDLQTREVICSQAVVAALATTNDKHSQYARPGPSLYLLDALEYVLEKFLNIQ